MASTNTIDITTPVVERVDQLFYEAILTAKTFSDNLGFQDVQFARDVFSLMEISVGDDILQDYACKPTATGSTDVGDNEFTIYKNSIKHEICYDVFKNTPWKDAIANLNNQGLPPEFQAAVLEVFGKKIMALIEGYMWNGKLTGTTFDGFKQVITDKLTAAALTGQIVDLGTNDPTAVSTVEAALRQVIAALPTNLKGLDSVRMFVHPSVEQALYVKYSQTGYTNIPQTDSLMIDRYKMVTIPNLDPYTIIAGIPGNMGVALLADGDQVTLNVRDMSEFGDNYALIYGSIGYGAGVATTDFAIGTFTPVP